MLLSSHVFLLHFATLCATAHTPSKALNGLILLDPSTSITTIPPLLNFSATRFPDNDTLSATGTLSATNHFPRFNDTVHQAVIRIEALYPSAIFVGADATSITGPTTDPDRLTDVRLTFSYRVGRYRSIFIEMEAWGQWTRPRPTTISPHKNLGPLPPNLGMDLVDASNLLRASGYMQPYDAVDVKWPTPYPVAQQQVFYFFQMEGTEPSTVAVGTRDRSVTPLD